MIPPRLLWAWSLLLFVVACQPTDQPAASGDLEAITSRLAATEERLAAIEAKLDDLGTKVDATVKSFEPVTAWATARVTEDEQREARREEREARRGSALDRLIRPGASSDSLDPSAPGSREIEGAAEGIECDDLDTSRIECKVDRAFIDHLMSNPALLTRQARIVPKIKDEGTEGYKLYGIRRGSLPKLLGMKNGDMVTSVNGNRLDSIDRAMELYTKLRRATRLEVGLERKGLPLVLVIEIVE